MLFPNINVDKQDSLDAGDITGELFFCRLFKPISSRDVALLTQIKKFGIIKV